MADVWQAEAAKLSFPYFNVTGSFYRDSLILANDLDRMALAIQSFREPLKTSVKEVIIPSIRLNFLKEGRPRWRGLTPETVRIRGSAHPILQRTRKLMKVATQLNIWKIDRNSAAIVGLDARVHYAKYHQSGTVHMPKRPFLDIKFSDQQEIEQIFYKWLVDRAIRRGKFK